MFGRERFWVVRGRVRVRTARAREGGVAARLPVLVSPLLGAAVVRRHELRADELPTECVEVSASLLAERTDVKVHRGQSFHLLCGFIKVLTGDGEHLSFPRTARGERAREEATGLAAVGIEDGPQIHRQWQRNCLL